MLGGSAPEVKRPQVTIYARGTRQGEPRGVGINILELMALRQVSEEVRNPVPYTIKALIESAGKGVSMYWDLDANVAVAGWLDRLTFEEGQTTEVASDPIPGFVDEDGQATDGSMTRTIDVFAACSRFRAEVSMFNQRHFS